MTMTTDHTPLTEQQLDSYAELAITANHDGLKVDPTIVTTLVDEVRRLQYQRRYLIGQIARQGAASGDADRKLHEFLATPGDETAPTPTPLTDVRAPADSREPLLWNDASGNLLTIHPDCVDDEDRPTVALQVRDVISESCFHVPQTEALRLAADLCAAAGFRDASEWLLAGAVSPTP
jgi:hypothetical protein